MQETARLRKIADATGRITDAPPKFDFIDDFGPINRGMHRKQPTVAGAPCLTRHLAFWAPWQMVDPVEGETHARRERWVNDIDVFLASLYRDVFLHWKDDIASGAVKTPKPTSFNREPDGSVRLFRNIVQGLESNDVTAPNAFRAKPIEKPDLLRYESFSFRFYYGGIPIKVRASLHNEYFTLNFVAEIYWLEDIGIHSVVCEKVRENFSILQQCTLSFWQEEGTGGSRSEENTKRTKIKDAADYFFDDFWEALFRERILDCLTTRFFANPDVMAKHGRDSIKIGDEPRNIAQKTGRIFADFRGAILSLESNPGDKQSESEVAGIDFGRKRAVITPILSPPFENPQNSKILDYTNPVAINEVSWAKLMTTFSPFIDAPYYSPKGTPPRGRAEYACCTMLDNRAGYISSLGGAPDWVNEKDPVRFLIVTQNRHRWQIGRLLERILQSGTLRVAATRDLNTLNKANEELQDIGRDLEAVKAQDVEQSLLTISLLRTKLKNLARVGITKINWRIYRTRYYVESFQQLQEELRINRIEGYQPYSEFVARRLGASWEFVERLGDRLERMMLQMDSVYQQVRLAQEAEQGHDRNEIQELAELVAPFAAAYYGGYVFHKVVKGMMGLDMPVPFADWVKSVSGSALDEVIFVGSAVLSLCLYWFLRKVLISKFRAKADDRV